MFDGILIALTAFDTGFAAAWAFGGRTREQLAAAKAFAAAQVQAADDKLELVADTRDLLARELKALSVDALDASSERFLKLATATFEKHREKAQGDLAAREQAVQSLVQPIREQLKQVDGKLGDLEKTRVSAYSALTEQVRGLAETQLPQLSRAASSLEKALRQPTVRGRWGEMQLKRVVETAGMLEHCDFVQQESAATEDGRVRPDLIVKLPGGRQLVIDAKAPLAAYLDAADATDDDVRRAHLARHAQLVRAHIVQLGRKAYWDTFSPSPEYVILFLPGEMLYSAALEADPTLIECGASEKVILAAPTTLIALLRTVACVWTQEALAVNAQQVAELGRELYERIAKLAEHWGDVGDQLGRAVDSYNKGVGTLETRVLVTARKFQELKAAPDDVEVAAPEPVEAAPRRWQAAELVAVEAPAPVSALAPKVDRVARIG